MIFRAMPHRTAPVPLVEPTPMIAELMMWPGWLIVFLLWTPALALIGIALMVAVSSRVNDPRTAQQFSAALVLPFLGLFIGQISGLLILGPVFALTVFLILLALVV